MRLAAAAEEAEELSDALLAAGATAVSLLPGAQAPALIECASDWDEAAAAAPLWPMVRLEALLPPGCVESPGLHAALGGRARRVSFLAERNWLAANQPPARPLRFGRLLILPEAATANVRADDVVVRLDPGLAFGSGRHASTSLCLDWLATAPLAGRRVLDVGSGSGILAIAAARLGARCTAIDNDPQARRTTADNARRNAVDVAVADDIAGAPGRFDVVLANLVANTLRELKAALAAKSTGTLVLSGLLPSQTAGMAAAYAPFRFTTHLRDGWAMLCGKRR